jgi:hypothetical protein
MEVHFMPKLGPRFRDRQSLIPPNQRVQAGTLNIVNEYGVVQGPLFPIWAQGPWVSAIREKCWDEVHPGPPFNVGGPFASVKIVRPQWNIQGVGSYPTDYLWGANWTLRYDGGFYDPIWYEYLDDIPESVYDTLGAVTSSLYPDLSAIGAGAYERLRPKLGKAGLGQAIVEIRDLPKMLKTTAKGFGSIYRGLGGVGDYTTKSFRKEIRRRYGRMLPKESANQFLNQQFGWVPFLKDLQDVYSVHQQARALKSQISRDNNTWIKRRRVDPTVESATVVYETHTHPGCQPWGQYFSGMYDASSLHHTITLIEMTEVWYEGSFKYYRPEFDWDAGTAKGPLAALQREMAIYGADLNPVLVWKVTPWSWLVDWFTNASAAIQRAQDWGSDSMVARYMYLMHRRRRIFELRSRFTTIDGKHHDYFWYRSADIKRRQPADSPFTFSLSSGDLSARQFAILAALGISRS